MSLVIGFIWQSQRYPENCSQTPSATSLIMNTTKPQSKRRIRSQELLKTTNTTSQILIGTLKYQRVKQRSARTSFLNSPNLILSPSTERLVKVVINTIILFTLCQKIMTPWEFCSILFHSETILLLVSYPWGAFLSWQGAPLGPSTLTCLQFPELERYKDSVTYALKFRGNCAAR